MDDLSFKANEYLEGRGISSPTLSALGIHWLSNKDATKDRYGYGKLAISPDGAIVFPLESSKEAVTVISIARNYYATAESQIQHLEAINSYRQSQRLQPVKRTPKYLLPYGDRAKGKVYDPYALLNPGCDKPVLFATEDIIGTIKAAQRGVRVLSTFGVWLGTREDLANCESDDWQHELAELFPTFMADSDALEKPSVTGALVRDGFVLDVRVGCFPGIPGEPQAKVGLDEFLDANPHATEQELAQSVEDNSADTLTWLESTLPGLIETLRERGHNPTAASKLATPVIKAAIRELLRHQDIRDLRVSGFYKSVLKPLGITLEILKPEERAVKIASGEMEVQTAIAEVIIDLVRRECDLFHDSEQVAYADLIVDDCRHTYPLRSVDFKRWVARRLYEEHDKSANNEGFQAARNTLEAIACFDGTERKVWLRVAQDGGKLYLDLANDQWQAVEIDAKGWRLVDRHPVRFIRPSTMGVLPTPITGGNLDELQELLGVEDDAWVLLITFLLYCFTTGPTFPVLLLAASRGSGKTTIAEFLKSLIDPGKAPLIGLTADHHKASVAGARRWMLCYDNISAINLEQSDLLCRLATGFGFSTRTLFETDGETVFELARPQILTAIDHVVTRDDLSDRLLMVQLPAIDKAKRLKKADLDAKLEDLRPKLLGALLTALSETLAEQPRINPSELPRMADYGHFAIAAETALGLPAGEFLRVFDANREASRQVVLESSPLAEAIQAMITRDYEFKGTASVLLKKLEEFAEESVVRSRFWPKASNTLTRQLNRLKPDLEAVGILIDSILEGTGNDRSRLISIHKWEVLHEF
ncbi:hypothetical protein DO97_03715 [Neosynechococcus sphagnicola sy1]|uniref:DUF3854 domain-containing protein n=1 Tax=Neosynechococcus sphagnicola sy1 TaxID=1497020 RepID=A0A098TLV1_9CYAN|nr:hypothetical protein [Neosynechococcus sphagnicola]KGF72847.1 hypothetical protein DO97_03715 [Neosynechococcus sphagnicola sy1]